MQRSGSETCLNCGTPLVGEFCSECGQRDVSLERGFWALFLEAVGEAFEADGRLFRTLPRFFFVPGLLVNEYLAGRRARYTSPVRVYIFAALVGFFSLHWTIDRSVTVNNDGVKLGVSDPDSQARLELGRFDPDEIADEAEEERTESLPEVEEVFGSDIESKFLAFQDMQPDEIAHELIDDAFSVLPQVMLFMLPLFGLLLKIVYPRHRYLDHLLLSLNLHSLGLLLLGIAGPINLLTGSALPGLVVALGLLLHLVVGMRRVYGKPWWSTILRAGFIVSAYWLMTIVSISVSVLIGVALS